MNPVTRSVNAVFSKIAFTLTYLTIVAICLTAVQTAAQTDGAYGYCEISLSGCPQIYDGRELVVPLDVIALSAQIQACGIGDSLFGDGISASPAVVFIIDNSTSMERGDVMGTLGNDPYGNRFRVTLALIDSIYAAHKDAEVGIVVFNETLVFDSWRDSNLVDFEGPKLLTYPRQSYLPLRPLNSMSVAGGSDPFYSGDTTWIGLIHNMFKDSTAGGRRYTKIKGSTQGGGGQDTDIALAFDAALEALKSTKRTNENQYIIFLSDGEPNVPYGTGQNPNPRYYLQDNYITEVSNTPTTYTVFLSRDIRAQVPASIDSMTNNIRNNGYSESNPSSDVWSLLSNDYDDLLAQMMEYIISPMLTKSAGYARSIVISSGNASDSTTATDGSFRFTRQLPIDSSEVTEFEMSIRYEVRKDSTWKLPDDRDTTVTVILAGDSLFTYSFTVRRSSETSPDWEAEQGLVSKCGQKPTLDLQYHGESLVNRVVTENMGSLTAVLNNSNGLFDYDSVHVWVMNANGTDVEKIYLTSSDGIWSGDFRRMVSADNSGDGILQHAEADSIIVVFRNPYIPLDTLRVSVRYASVGMMFYDAPGDPDVGNPRPMQLPDTISVKAGDTTDIFVKFFDENSKYTPSFESDPSRIRWETADPDASVASEGLNGQFYTETAGTTHTVISTYSGDAEPKSRAIVIHVIPGDPHYLDIVFDTVNIVNRVSPAALESTRNYEFGKHQRHAVFFVVERDRLGNIIGLSDSGVSWNSSEPTTITAVSPNDGSSADINKHSSGGSDVIFVTADKPGLVSCRVNVQIVGDRTLAASPNPFIPGVSNVVDIVNRLDPSGKTYEYYRNIIEGRTPTGETTMGSNTTGILIAATAPRSIQTNRNGTPKATIIIYDAVGNIVFRCRQSDIAQTNDGNTIGFIWDGKTREGKTAGAGTYLVKITGTQINGDRLRVKRLIGITYER